MAAEAESAAAANPESMYEGIDMVFSPKFRKGPRRYRSGKEVQSGGKHCAEHGRLRTGGNRLGYYGCCGRGRALICLVTISCGDYL